MAFDSTIDVTNAAAGTNHYAEVSQDSTGSTRIETSTTIDTPKLLVIRHNQQKDGKSTLITDRHLVQLVHTKLDTAGIARSLVLNSTLQVPRGGTFTVTEVEDLIYQIYSFVSGGTTTWDNLKALLRGER